MKNNNRHFFKLFSTEFTIILLVMSLTTTNLYGQAEEISNKTGMDTSSPAETTTEETVEGFQYLIGDRGDPFMPFLVEKKESTVDMNQIVDTTEKLEGMQLFEPGQLTLVAIAQSNRQHFAMVQDFTGQGYIINKGMKIGRRGTIIDIAPNQVVIEEIATTLGGKILTNEIVMYLKQEGELK